MSRSPLGLRGLKFHPCAAHGTERCRRSPLGLRGLKFKEGLIIMDDILSQPTRAAWIEIWGRNNL